MISPSDVKDLSASARQWLADLGDAYAFEPYEEKIALVAAQALDRMERCRKQIAKDGLMTQGRVQKCHPLMLPERQSMQVFVALLKQLGLQTDRRFTQPVPGLRSHHAPKANGY